MPRRGELVGVLLPAVGNDIASIWPQQPWGVNAHIGQRLGGRGAFRLCAALFLTNTIVFAFSGDCQTCPNLFCCQFKGLEHTFVTTVESFAFEKCARTLRSNYRPWCVYVPAAQAPPQPVLPIHPLRPVLWLPHRCHHHHGVSAHMWVTTTQLSNCIFITFVVLSHMFTCGHVIIKWMKIKYFSVSASKVHISLAAQCLTSDCFVFYLLPVCKSCIVKHFFYSNRCPTCSIIVHQTQPHYNIR